MSPILGNLHAMQFNFQLPLARIAQSAYDWKAIALGLTAASSVFETLILIKQLPNYSKPAPPPSLKDHFPPDTYAKSQSYGRAKALFTLAKGAWGVLEGGLSLYFDLFAWSWGAAAGVLTYFGYGGDREIAQSIIFAGILTLISTVTALPWDYYYAFVLEEAHGFNKMTRLTFVTDLLKSFLVGAAFGVPFLAAFLGIIRHFGQSFVYYLMGFLLAFQLILVVLYPLVIQPLFNKLTPLEVGSSLRTRIEGLASRLRFPLKHLYQIDGSKRSSHSNAYFYGLPWSKHIVIFDTLIAQSSDEEVEAVLAHELGHWSMSHPTKLLLINQVHVFLLLSSFPPFLTSRTFLPSFGFPALPADAPFTRTAPILPTFLLFQLLLQPIEHVMQFAMNAVTRAFEYQADAFAVGLGGDFRQRLADALTKLHVKNLSTLHVDWLYSAYHYSHPTLPERLKAMDKLEAKKDEKKEL
ncbi:metalloendopeptidase [Calocera viscosa TUFC12733]|uniref:CAAX prenyl protease n=1 Tax=Calocera viscosa (strain TUFC12733) TaxID=1330018 RepID=A0A167N262_CALVF|nr:metalloendopeptidase [Calocera viscosa TUFC12733]